MKTTNDYLREANRLMTIGPDFEDRRVLKALELQAADYESALQEQKEFYEWASCNGWVWTGGNEWYKPKEDVSSTTKDLVQAWKGEKDA